MEEETTETEAGGARRGEWTQQATEARPWLHRGAAGRTSSEQEAEPCSPEARQRVGTKRATPLDGGAESQ